MHSGRLPAILCIIIVAGCTGHHRSKGTVGLYAVDPFFTDAFEPASLLEPIKVALLKEVAQRRFVDNHLITQLGLTPELKPEQIEKALEKGAAETLHQLAQVANLRNHIKDPVLPDWAKLLYTKADITPEEIVDLNRVLILTQYPQRVSFLGAFLKGPQAICNHPEYKERNGIKLGQGYRIAFDKVHVRYIDEVGGAEFLVYVELRRGSDLEPFYSQVIVHETAMARNSSPPRTTIMTPAFTYEKDEPILLRIVGIELDTEEEIRIGNQLKAIGQAAENASALVPQAAMVPTLAQLASTLFDLAKDGDDIEFQCSIGFYPFETFQIKTKTKPSGRPASYAVELPLVAAQFVMVKDEDPQRRVPFESGWDYFTLPIARIVPNLLWLAALIPSEIFFGTTGGGHLYQHWRFPGVFDEPVDGPSYTPLEEESEKLAILNDQLRKGDKRMDDVKTRDDRPREPYTDKTHVIFSVLKTEAGSRDPAEIVLRQQTKRLGDLLKTAANDNGAGAIQQLADLGKKLSDSTQLLTLINSFADLPKNDPDRIKKLLENLKSSANEGLQNEIVRHLNFLTAGSGTKADYVGITWDPKKPAFTYNPDTKKWDKAK